MKNDYCELSQDQIHALPDRFKGFLLSPFQFNLRNGMVAVPEDTFKEMIDIIAECAAAVAAPMPAQAVTDEEIGGVWEELVSANTNDIVIAFARRLLSGSAKTDKTGEAG